MFSRKDNWSSFFETAKTYEFLSPSTENETFSFKLIPKVDNILFVQQYGLSKNKNVSSRTVYNLFDLVSDLGGLQGFIMVLGATLTAIFSPTLARIQKM